jgi:hypothetical protein
MLQQIEQQCFCRRHYRRNSSATHLVVQRHQNSLLREEMRRELSIKRWTVCRFKNTLYFHCEVNDYIAIYWERSSEVSNVMNDTK